MYVHTEVCKYIIFRSFNRNWLYDVFAFIILLSSLGQIIWIFVSITNNNVFAACKRKCEPIFRGQRSDACWDLPCSSCSCQWRTCWRVADGGRVPFTPVRAHSFYTPECHSLLCVSERRVSTRTKPLFERVNNECVSGLQPLLPSSAAAQTTYLRAPSH